MAFGPKNRNKPTPQWASDLMDLVIKVLGIISGFLVAASFIPQQLSDILSPVITILLIPIAFEFKKWFSSRATGKKVDISEVDVIKDKPFEDDGKK